MAHLQSAHAELSASIPFSLFEGDFLTRVFQRLGMGSYRTIDLVKRSVLLISITWVPLAILAVVAELHWIQPPGQNFFVDFAAYGQMLLSLPIFLLAERVIDWQHVKFHAVSSRLVWSKRGMQLARCESIGS